MITRGKQISIEYLAGVVDGEGNLHAHQVSVGSIDVQLCVANTCLELLEAIMRTFGGKVRSVNHNSKIATERNWSIVYRWHIGGQAALPIIKALEPFLIVKHEQATLAIEILEQLSPGKGNKLSIEQRARLEQVLVRFKAINARGRAAATTKREGTQNE